MVVSSLTSDRDIEKAKLLVKLGCAPWLFVEEGEEIGIE